VTEPHDGHPDEVSFPEVYRQHFEFVWRTLRRLGVPEQDVADACQEVFIVIHRRLPSFEGRSRLTTWIFQICLNLTLERARRAHRRHEVLGDAVISRLPARAPDPLAELEQRDKLARFQAALDSMELEQRAAFILFELEDMTGPAVAEALAVPLGTAYTRLRAARQAFEAALERTEVDERLLLRRGRGR
jgi:RNA polymerase sigma-70 factor (ECF subfamily)